MSVRASIQNNYVTVFTFHIWIPYQKIADPYFLGSELSPLVKFCPFKRGGMKFWNQDILKIVVARSFKLGQLIKDNE